MAISDNLKKRMLSALRSPEATAEMTAVLDHTLTTEITITPAQMLTAFTTPIDLIPAPGAGYAVIVNNVYCALTFGTTAYAIATSDVLGIKYVGSTVVAGLTEAFLESASSNRQYVLPAVTAYTPVSNAKIVAQLSTANATLGNSPIKIKISYKIVEA